MTDERQGRRASEGLFYGLALVLVGLVFMLDRLEVFELGRMWQWWPLVPIVLGLARIAAWQSADSVASGLTWMLFGLWFLVSQRGWYGLDWSNSWPLVLVAIGAGMIARPMLERAFGRPSACKPSGGEPHEQP